MPKPREVGDSRVEFDLMLRRGNSQGQGFEVTMCAVVKRVGYALNVEQRFRVLGETHTEVSSSSVRVGPMPRVQTRGF